MQNLAPQDSEINAVYQESTDDPQPLEDKTSSWRDPLGAFRKQVRDGLQNLVSTAKTSALSLMDRVNDPALNCVVYGGSTKEEGSDPNNAVDNAARCGALKLLIPGPYPVTQNAAAGSYMNGIQDAGMATLGMATSDDSN